MSLSVDSGYGNSMGLPSYGSSFDGSGMDSQSQTQILQNVNQIEALLWQLLAALQAENGNGSSSGGGGGGGGGFDPSMLMSSGGGGAPNMPEGQQGSVTQPVTQSVTQPAGNSSGNSSDFGGSTLGPGFPQQLEPYRNDIESASQQTGVPANLIAAQIWQESRGQVGAASTNSNGLTDTGLMQVDPATFGSLQQEHPELQGKNLSDPATNILAGSYYMSDMAKQFGGNWSEALRAYNSGPNDVNPNNLSDVTDGDPNYVNEVTQIASTIQNGGQVPA